MIALALAALAFAFSGAPTLGYVVDGDTLRLQGGEYVRVVGIDTPERGDCGFDEASEALERLVHGTVRLVRPFPTYDNRDRYGRLLRYVHDGGIDAGLALIRQGMAEAYKPYPHPRYTRYLRAELHARALHRGLWKLCGTP